MKSYDFYIRRTSRCVCFSIRSSSRRYFQRLFWLQRSTGHSFSFFFFFYTSSKKLHSFYFTKRLGNKYLLCLYTKRCTSDLALRFPTPVGCYILLQNVKYKMSQDRSGNRFYILSLFVVHVCVEFFDFFDRKKKKINYCIQRVTKTDEKKSV